jgi:hypothetical protein
MSTPTEEPPVTRAKAWLVTAQTTLDGYETLLAEGDANGARAALKAFRESLRMAEDSAYEASP